MTINTNSVGNYSLLSMQKAQGAVSSAKQSGATAINQDEKEFFMKMYPDKKTDILDYHFYQRSGKMSGVSVGSLLDRRM